jgi:hypothetical protein
MNDFAVARRRMVREQLADAGLDDRRVLRAMEAVPRHRFVPRCCTTARIRIAPCRSGSARPSASRSPSAS